MKRLTPFVVDLAFAIGLFVLGVENRADIDRLAAHLFTREPDLWNLFLIALQTLPLAWRRRYPRAVLATVIGAFALDRMADYPGTIASAGMVLAFHAIGSELSPRLSARIGFGSALAVAVFTAVGAIQLESVVWVDVISTGLMVTVPVILGREVNQRRTRLRQLEHRAEFAEAETKRKAAEAVADERARIARELHDVVAHQMVVMTIQAEGARRMTGDSSPQVAAALDTIRQTGRSAMDEMRRMVGLLRADGETSELAPQPGLALLDHLVDQMRDSGLDVDAERVGQVRCLPSGLDLHAYRIIQESLTNAMKHAGPSSHTDVTVTYGLDTLDLEIRSEGSRSTGHSDTGHGLIGMRERVSLLGGQLTAGPTSRGFQVHATLPVPQ